MVPIPIILTQLNKVEKLRPIATNPMGSSCYCNTQHNCIFYNLPILFRLGISSMKLDCLNLHPPYPQDHSSYAYFPSTVAITTVIVQQDNPPNFHARFYLEYPKVLSSQIANSVQVVYHLTIPQLQNLSITQLCSIIQYSLLNLYNKR